ncbi:MAG: DNA polymerase IV [Oscillospiraceae bacterium]
MERVIFHCDANCFFASVELLSHPELCCVPVAVGGRADMRQGIILAKNEAAKKYGVSTAETIWQAKRKCPTLTILPPHHEKYVKYSQIINEIYSDYSDRVEPFGIDESWLDMTGTWQLFGKSPLEVANRLRCEIKDKTGLTVSIGVSFNKIFAKLGSDYKKPDAVTEITREEYKKIVWPLPVSALLYVGKNANETLSKLGIHNIGQLAAADDKLLFYSLGKLGAELASFARGEDTSIVLRADEREDIKSIGNGLTFTRDLVSDDDIKAGASTLATTVAIRLRKAGLYCTSLQVHIKTPDLKSICRQKQLPYPTHLERDILNAALELINANRTKNSPVRMLTITAQKLTASPLELQTSFLEDKPDNAKLESLEKSLDKIRDKYGKNAVSSGNIIKNDIGI